MSYLVIRYTCYKMCGLLQAMYRLGFPSVPPVRPSSVYTAQTTDTLVKFRAALPLVIIIIVLVRIFSLLFYTALFPLNTIHSIGMVNTQVFPDISELQCCPGIPGVHSAPRRVGRRKIFQLNLTTICVNVHDRVCCLFARYLLPDRLRYGNTNGTMLSQIVRGMF